MRRSLYPLYIYSTCVTERAFTFVSNTTHKPRTSTIEASPPRPPAPPQSHTPPVDCAHKAATNIKLSKRVRMGNGYGFNAYGME